MFYSLNLHFLQVSMQALVLCKLNHKNEHRLCTIKAAINGSLYAMMTRPLTVQYANRCKKDIWL